MRRQCDRRKPMCIELGSEPAFSATGTIFVLSRRSSILVSDWQSWAVRPGPGGTRGSSCVLLKCPTADRSSVHAERPDITWSYAVMLLSSYFAEKGRIAACSGWLLLYLVMRYPGDVTDHPNGKHHTAYAFYQLRLLLEGAQPSRTPVESLLPNSEWRPGSALSDYKLFNFASSRLCRR